MKTTANESGTSKLFKGKARYLALSASLIAIAIFLFTYSSIQRSKDDSLAILKKQGSALLHSLILSADNAIKANSILWEKTSAEMSDLALHVFEELNLERISADMASTSDTSTVLAVYLFDWQMALTDKAINPHTEFPLDPPEEIFEALSDLIADSGASAGFIPPDPGDTNAVAFYLESDTSSKIIVCIAVSLIELNKLESEIGIGYLIKRLGTSGEVEYILFQSEDGLVFSSVAVDSVLSIGSDPFLQSVMSGREIESRLFTLIDKEALELAAPFSSDLYPDGVFRLGVSLEGLHSLTSASNRRMALLAVALFLSVTLVGLYYGARQERAALGMSLAKTSAISETILETMHSGVLAVNSDGSIEMINGRLREMFNIEEDIAGANDWTKTKLGDALPGNIFDFNKDNPPPDEIEWYQNDERRSYLLSVAPFNLGKIKGTSSNEKHGGALIVYDFTRQKELEETAARKERLSELGDLAAGVAHEIRNPLNAVSLAAQRLETEFGGKLTENSDDFAFFTSQIRNETKRLDAIVTRLLGLTRAPKSEVTIIDISEAVTEWAHFLEPDFKKNSARVRVSLDENAVAYADRDKLRQALGNLYRNSIEAHQVVRGDDPFSESKIISEPEINISVTRKSDHVQLSFTDNGAGISAEIAAKLFTPYYTTKESGSGLGLAISYRLISDMKGTLTYDSSYQNGARFVITLPSPVNSERESEFIPQKETGKPG
ncbi:MAG: hypothetical protein IIB00_08110 [candidate division Zixibacteria bacterium]|nr:hypothetical protein [candidate division Zixibacteria bacterium]